MAGPWALLLCLVSQAPVTLPEVTVPLPEQEAEAEAGSVEKRDSTLAASKVESKKHAGEAKDVSELLSTTPGVVVQDRGGAGQTKTISIRGASPNGVMVLLDGLPLSQSGTNIDVSRLPVSLIQSVEVLRGGAGARFGQGGLGGVVNVVTRPVTGEKRLFAELQGGSFESFSGNVGASARLLDGDTLVLLYGAKSSGNFFFPFDEAPQWDGNPVTLRRRQNNDSAQGGFLSKYQVKFGKLQLNVLLEGQLDERGLAGTVQNPTFDARQLTRRLTTAARLAKKESGREWSALLWGRGEGLRLQGGLFGSPGWQTDAGAGVEFQGQLLVASSHLLSGTMQAAYETVQRDIDNPSWVRLSAMVGDEWWLSDNVALLFSTRLDAAAKFLEASPKVGVLWQWEQQFELRANAGRAARIPSFLELYVRQGQLLPNSELQPEAALFADVAVSRKTKNTEVSLGAFYSRYQNLISYEFYPPLLARPFNFAEAQVAGLEVEGRFQKDGWFSASGSYTFLFSQNLSSDARYYLNALPYRPQHKAYVRVLAGPSWLSGRADVFYQSAQFQNRTETLVLPARALLNAGLQSVFLKKPQMTLSLEVKNLLDVYTQDLDGYPLPSRGVYVTWGWETPMK